MKKTTDKEFLKLVGDSQENRIKLAYAKEHNTSVPIQYHGQYYPNKNELHPWGITPSSEDKGYSSY